MSDKDPSTVQLVGGVAPDTVNEVFRATGGILGIGAA